MSSAMVGWTLSMVICCVVIGRGSAAPNTVRITRMRNGTAHCLGAVVANGVILTLADCLFNATSKKEWSMLQFDQKPARQVLSLPQWHNTTNPVLNFALALVAQSEAPAPYTDVFWSSYGVEALQCSVNRADCTAKKENTLDLANGTLIELDSTSSRALPGTPIYQKEANIFGLIQDKCDKGWGVGKKRQCGLRIPRPVFDFICKEAKNRLPGCRMPLLMLGLDTAPTLIATADDYRSMAELPNTYTLLVLFCAQRLCSDRSCELCARCSGKKQAHWDSLDRLYDFANHNVVVKRVDVQKLDVDIDHVPFVVLRPKSQSGWFEHRGKTSDIVKDLKAEVIKTNQPNMFSLSRFPDILPKRTKRTPPAKKRKITCGYCKGNDPGFTKCGSVFSGAQLPTVPAIGNPASHCFLTKATSPVYAVYYNCDERIPVYTALRIKVRDTEKVGKRKQAFKPVDDEIDPEYQASDFDYRSSSSRIPKMHKGHLIAYNYSTESKERAELTMFYINSVPQHAVFNRDIWKISESYLVLWTNNNCNPNEDVFIVVGATPSDMYYGNNGQSATQDTDGYRLNIPTHMWTAACCTDNTDGNVIYYGFYGPNEADGTTDNNSMHLKTFLDNKGIRAFPGQPSCYF